MADESKMVDKDELSLLRRMAENKTSKLNPEGIRQHKTIMDYAGRGMEEALPESSAVRNLKPLGEQAGDAVSDEVASKIMKQSAIKNVMKKLGKSGLGKAAGLALGPLGMMASGAAEAFDVESLGEGSDNSSQEDMLRQIEEYKKMGAMQDGGVASKEERLQALLEKANANRAKRMEANVEDNKRYMKERSSRDQVEGSRLAEEQTDMLDKKTSMLENAMKDAKTPEYKERIRQLLMRRR